jgi:hypothetical protein
LKYAYITITTSVIIPQEIPKEIHRITPGIDANMSVEQNAEITDTSDNHKWIDGRRYHNAESPYELPNDINE